MIDFIGDLIDGIIKVAFVTIATSFPILAFAALIKYLF